MSTATHRARTIKSSFVFNHLFLVLWKIARAHARFRHSHTPKFSKLDFFFLLSFIMFSFQELFLALWKRAKVHVRFRHIQTKVFWKSWICSLLLHISASLFTDISPRTRSNNQLRFQASTSCFEEKCQGCFRLRHNRSPVLLNLWILRSVFFNQKSNKHFFWLYSGPQ